jgi:DNA invertase Pin-like site-specific DNA recombinase
VSTGQQADSGLSLDAQERRVIAEAEAAGYEVEILREEGRSAKSIAGRPLLRDALARLAAGEAAALFVAKTDRLARRTFDVLSVLERAQVEGWRLVVVESGLDTASVMGRAYLTLGGMFAEMELEAIRERHRAWHAEARERGKVWGVDHGPTSTLSAEVLGRIVRERAAGRSLRAIAGGLNMDGVPTARGGREWHASTVSAVLSSPVGTAYAREVELETLPA